MTWEQYVNISRMGNGMRGQHKDTEYPISREIWHKPHRARKRGRIIKK
jgi:hypothetical protein